MLLQASARMHESGTVNPFAPRMFVSEGCDGSTAILYHAYNILSLHGIEAGPPNVQKELLDPKRNPFIGVQNQDIIVAMKRLAEDRRQNNFTLVFKSILGRDDVATLDARLIAMGTLAVYNTRRNVLDRLVCMIRDCFVNTEPSGPYGYPVDANGKPSDLCFDRRSSEEEEAGTTTDDSDYKAYLNVTNVFDEGTGGNVSQIVYNLNFFIREQDKGEKMLKDAGYHAARLTYEDLVAFEEDRKEVSISATAWSELLTSWGVNPSKQKVENYLRKNAGSRQPAPTRDVVYNIEELRSAFEQHPTFKNMKLIREAQD